MKRFNDGSSGRAAIACSVVALGALLVVTTSPAVVFAEDDRAEHEVPGDGDPLEDDDRPTFDADEEPDSDLDARQFRERREFEGLQRQDEQIVRLRDLLDRTPEGDPDRAEYLYNLSEIFWERSQYYDHSAIEQQDECFMLEQEGRDEEARRCEFRVEDMEAESERLREESIDLYVEIIRNYPDFDELDEIYFQLGSNMMDVGEEEEGLEIFRRLLSEFPDTRYLPQTLVYFGDYYFEEGELFEALDAYQKVVEYPDAPVYQYAHYKMGWTYYNLDNYSRALEQFLTVVELAKAADEGTADRAMLRQARNDIVRTYAKVGSPGEAIDFFQDIAPDREDWLPMAENLAIFYGDEAAFADSSAMYRNLIEVNSSSHKVLDYQYEIVRNTATIDSYSEDALEEMVRLIQLVQAADDGQFEEDRDLYEEELREKARNASRDWANTYHREAQRTRNTDIYTMAHYLYRGYRQTFPDAEDIYEQTFFHAELLYELQQWERAAATYEKVLELDPEGEYTEDAVHATILALFEIAETSEERAEIQGDIDPLADDEDIDIPEPEEMPELEQRLMTATANYIEYVPDGDQIVEVKYHRARTLYDYNHFEDAVELFEDIAFNHSDHDLADVSANLHLATLELLGDFHELGDAVSRYIDEQPIDDPEFQADLSGMHEAIRYNICVLHDEDEEWEQAAHCYLEYVQEFPNSEQADMALYNAALDFERVHEIGMAIQLRQQLLQLFPDSEHAPETLYNLGGNYHAWAIYGEASDHYEDYVEEYANDDTDAYSAEDAEDALSNAATFRHGLQQYDRAIDNYRTYLDLFGDDNPERAAEVFFEIGRIYQEQDRYDAAYEHFEDYIAQYGREGTNDHLLEAHLELGLHHWERLDNRDRALDEFERTLDVYEAMDEEAQQQLTSGADAAAEAKFMIGEDLFEEAAAIAIDSSDDEELTEQTEKKNEAADEAREVFEEVIVFGRPDWAIAALYRIGSGYQDFADTLRDSPVPDELDPGPREQYKGLLEDYAMAFEDNAAELYERALETARDANWYNEYSELAETRLSEIRPAEYREPAELRARPKYQNEGFMRSSFIEEIEDEDLLEELTDDELAGDEPADSEGDTDDGGQADADDSIDADRPS